MTYNDHRNCAFLGGKLGFIALVAKKEADTKHNIGHKP